jgi:hypothetical protein
LTLSLYFEELLEFLVNFPLLLEESICVNTFWISFEEIEELLEFEKLQIDQTLIDFYDLGFSYLEAKGVDKDLNKSHEYFKRAADIGNIEVMF